MMSSSSSSVSSSRRIGEENNEDQPLTGMLLGLQELEERIIAEGTTTTCTTNTQLRVPSIMDIIGCDITIEDIQSTKQELINQKIDLKMDVNTRQHLPSFIGSVTPMIRFCYNGKLLIVRLLFLIGADCTKLCEDNYFFPMLAAATYGHLDVCKWLFEYGGYAKYQINKVTSDGDTPLFNSYSSWHHGICKGDKTYKWLLLNGGGQHLSPKALRCFIGRWRKKEMNSNYLVLWMRENIQLHNTFILLLCGATAMITSSLSSSEPHQERSLQILDGHPGIMELIGEYVGVIRGKEFRMLQEFDELVIEYFTTEESSSDDSDDNAEDY